MCDEHEIDTFPLENESGLDEQEEFYARRGYPGFPRQYDGEATMIKEILVAVKHNLTAEQLAFLKMKLGA
jgi:hypothetical protein